MHVRSLIMGYYRYPYAEADLKSVEHMSRMQILGSSSEKKSPADPKSVFRISSSCRLISDPEYYIAYARGAYHFRGSHFERAYVADMSAEHTQVCRPCKKKNRGKKRRLANETDVQWLGDKVRLRRRTPAILLM